MIFSNTIDFLVMDALDEINIDEFIQLGPWNYLEQVTSACAIVTLSTHIIPDALDLIHWTCAVLQILHKHGTEICPYEVADLVGIDPMELVDIMTKLVIAEALSDDGLNHNEPLLQRFFEIMEECKNV